MSYDVYGRVPTGAGEEAEAFYAGNYTSNCSRMWACAISGTFDDPKTSLADLDGSVCGDLVQLLESAQEHMRDPANDEKYRAMNPSNGWGEFVSAREFLHKILDGCRRHPLALLRVSH